ncbi:hypothetical protein V8G54_010720 [Vigna mungo]|uniref:Peptidase C1A papain C-terminal domain-containing protein n=1 Tax=Vigna mungo TaxID=3915 RepID=A0AAQ3P0L4_VIGMU
MFVYFANVQKNAKVVSIDSYEDVNSYDELALKKAVANQPVSVAIEGGGKEFQLYSSKNAKVVSIDSYEDVNSYDELALKKAVANQPVSVAIEGGGREFQLYSSVSFQSDFIHDLGKEGVPIA